jgi:hypothetical protein
LAVLAEIQEDALILRLDEIDDLKQTGGLVGVVMVFQMVVPTSLILSLFEAADNYSYYSLVLLL